MNIINWQLNHLHSCWKFASRYKSVAKSWSCFGWWSIKIVANEIKTLHLLPIKSFQLWCHYHFLLLFTKVYNISFAYNFLWKCTSNTISISKFFKTRISQQNLKMIAQVEIILLFIDLSLPFHLLDNITTNFKTLNTTICTIFWVFNISEVFSCAQ